LGRLECAINPFASAGSSIWRFGAKDAHRMCNLNAQRSWRQIQLTRKDNTIDELTSFR